MNTSLQRRGGVAGQGAVEGKQSGAAHMQPYMEGNNAQPHA
jgi:hypothetical protein